MPANYSTNPTNPANEAGGQPTGTVQPPVQNQQPKSIRDYLNLARSQGQVPSFTNRTEGSGYQVGPSAGMEAPQAISEGPQSEYEMMPRGQRMRIDPYIRTQERIKTFLPEMWQQMFPGVEPGSGLSQEDLTRWQGAVKETTSRLLKRFDKEYEWSLKNDQSTIKQRSKDEQHWQDVYVRAELAQNPPVDRETGAVLTPQEFIDKQMGIADEMKFKKEVDAEEEGQGTLDDFDVNQVGQVIQSRPELGQSIRTHLTEALSQLVGGPVSEAQLSAMQADPHWKETFGRLTREALDAHEEEILKYIK